MSQVTVTIAGRTYRIACAPGEEHHLEGLAALYDSKIEEMRSAFGEIGDMRLHVMAAITIADELAETRKSLDAARREMADLRILASSGGERTQLVETRMAESLEKVAERLERLARSLNPAPQQAPGG